MERTDLAVAGPAAERLDPGLVLVGCGHNRLNCVGKIAAGDGGFEFHGGRQVVSGGMGCRVGSGGRWGSGCPGVTGLQGGQRVSKRASLVRHKVKI